MGPLVTRAHRDRVASYVDAAEAEGGKLVVDGRDWEVDGEAEGFWLGPTLVDNVTPEMSVYRDEVFGPVLAVVRTESFDEALELVNANPYGNGTALFTTSGPASCARSRSRRPLSENGSTSSTRYQRPQGTPTGAAAAISSRSGCTSWRMSAGGLPARQPSIHGAATSDWPRKR